MANRNWTREELLLSFNLYLRIPFGKISQHNVDVIHLAELINRTPSSVAIRLANIAHIDPYHQQRGVKGMSAGKNIVQPIWDEFIKDKESLLFESECILAAMEKSSIEAKFENLLSDTKSMVGESRIREVAIRVNQDLFRRIVLGNYNSQCALSGINEPDLLIASHIVPWSVDTANRLNPSNGICLSALYDRAFDRGLIGFSDNFEVLFSTKLQQNKYSEFYARYFGHLENQKLNLPEKFVPEKEFLQFHRDSIFEKKYKF